MQTQPKDLEETRGGYHDTFLTSSRCYCVSHGVNGKHGNETSMSKLQSDEGLTELAICERR